MIELDIPGAGRCVLEHLVLDMNGTIALDGAPVPGVDERLDRLSGSLSVVVLTAGTHGRVDGLARGLGVHVDLVTSGREAEQKRDRVEAMGAESVVAIGNGANDALMLAEARVGIAVVGPEGAARAAVEACDVVTSNIKDALDLLLSPKRLVATLRR